MDIRVEVFDYTATTGTVRTPTGTVYLGKAKSHSGRAGIGQNKEVSLSKMLRQDLKSKL